MWKDEFFSLCWRWWKRRLKNNCEGGKLIANKLQKSDSLLSSKSHVVYETRYIECCCSENFKCNFSSLKFRYRVSITYTRWMWSMWHQSIRKLEDNLKIEFMLVARLLSFSTQPVFLVLCSLPFRIGMIFIYLQGFELLRLFIFICRSIFSRSRSYTKYVRSLLHLCTFSSLRCRTLATFTTYGPPPKNKFRFSAHGARYRTM